MGFFNSLTDKDSACCHREEFSMVCSLTRSVLTLDLRLRTAIAAGLLVFFLYLGSRLLILFSGIDTPYYSKERKGSPYENTAFYQTAQWVGKFYHYHDVVLFAFMVVLSIAFLISL